MDSGCKDILIVKMAVGELVVYVFLVYLDARDRDRNKYFDESIAAIVGGACIVVMEDFNGHVEFLGEQNNYGGEMLLEFAERWGLVILICDRCRGVYTRSVRNESVIDYIIVYV